jgi:hypothetical protein
VVQEIYNEMTDTAAARTVAEMSKGAPAAIGGTASNPSEAARAVIIRALRGADAVGREPEPEPEPELEEELENAVAEGGALWWFGLIARSFAITVGGLILLFLLRLLYELI